MKELEEKILYQYGWLTVISSDQGTHSRAYNVQQRAERYPPWSTSLIENWN